MVSADVLKKYDLVIGIEVHCQLATKSKIFCTSSNQFGSSPNVNIDPTCVGLPGALPVLNEACVDLGIRMGLATNSTICPVSIFARKNYFYPDLPKGYQITQFDKPLCKNGIVELSSGKKVQIERIQLEEDAGKNLHGEGASLLDFNRSGVGLIEIVSAPDMNSPEEASEYLRRVHSYAVSLEISDGDMERGNFRADANVSLKLKGSSVLGQRTEIKNLNSFRFLEKAIAVEAERQFEVLERGGQVVMETRGYDADTNTTFSQRSKENAHDYRYFPEPDLPPLIVSPERIQRVRLAMPELPERTVMRFTTELGLAESDARVIASSRVKRAYFEELVALLKGKVEAKTIANFFLSEILKAAKNKADSLAVSTDEVSEIPVSLSAVASLLALVGNGTLNMRTAKEVFEQMLVEGLAPEEIVKSKGLVQVSDESLILELVSKVLSENEPTIKEYLSGKDKLLTFFVGKTMKLAGGKLNPARLNEVLKSELEKRR